ncbi:MAG: hypothetical protein COV91_00280 [Candidatus Taylorbacteria bacterium CG11_big_fil_rev_8_21_14_0_20_46_11]|uniref:Uncharacterized protein n=1 Tax=Candidatus Taylorbacteria bacterium CG11_big_fil_rev_8_21_14_0_20_46_11 TaxID=1975025 RepID=A0A2H0KD29_9BACT|nr:MAG: hypothetical protein COV91_00280 [Candidatus Taylorbacteria bacterium CG11_big_fil_rev_8_21_14_0_20_46_11]
MATKANKQKSVKEHAKLAGNKGGKGKPRKDFIGSELRDKVVKAVLAVYEVPNEDDLEDMSKRRYSDARQGAVVAFKQSGDFADRVVGNQLGMSLGSTGNAIRSARKLTGEKKKKLERLLSILANEKPAEEEYGSAPESPVAETKSATSVTGEAKETTAEQTEAQQVAKVQSAVREVFCGINDIFSYDAHELVSDAHGAFLYVILVRYLYIPRSSYENMGVNGFDVDCLIGQATIKYHTNEGFRAKVDQVLTLLPALSAT